MRNRLTFDRPPGVLRCDPDVVMIGEIRDRETADAAVEASPHRPSGASTCTRTARPRR